MSKGVVPTFEGLPLLAMISGSCGLGYEIIYVRMFSNYFGDAFVISAALLTTVFIGIAVGAYQSWRFVGKLGLIEIAIGLYSIAIASLLSFQGFSVVALIGAGSFANALKLYILLLPPMFLIGTCIPLFAEYVRRGRATTGVSNSFPLVYALYNLGAVASILLIEFYLFRQLGILRTVFAIGALNLCTGAYLIAFVEHRLGSEKAVGNVILGRTTFMILFLMSFASGLFQLFCLQLVSAIFGPLKENFALVLASAILGLFVGPIIFQFYKLKFKMLAKLVLLFLGVSVMSLGVGIDYWSHLVSRELSGWALQLTKFSFVALFCLPIFSLLGMLVPLVVHQLAPAGQMSKEGLGSGTVLGVSSLANGIGAFCFVTLFYQWFSLPTIAILIGLLVLVAFWIDALWRSSRLELVLVTSLSLLFGAAAVQVWPYADLLFGYEAIADHKQLNFKRKHFSYAETYKFRDQNASLVYLDDDSHTLMFNGYQSLSFDPKSRTALHESIVGVTAALFSKNTQTGLVFGLGTGISAGSTAQVYDQVDVVEINPAMLNIPPHFKEENFDLLNASNVVVRMEDGISTLVQNNKKYDVIVNTVTSPRYFSAIKMYTKDFYALVQSGLSPGGVYSSWFDLNIGHRGISIMLNTLEANFDRCRYFVMSTGYFNVVCGEGVLSYQSSAQIKHRFESSPITSVMQEHGFRASFEQVLQALEVGFGKEFFSRSSVKQNTLDRPMIEFVNLNSPLNTKTQDAIFEVFEENFKFRKLAQNSSRDHRTQCAVIQHMIRHKLKACRSN